jgi:glycosyltransferase involved in cell wall biosynthesis
MIFSIIIPTYNRATIIGRAISSVLKQTFVDFEVLVVDDGSLDNTGEIVGRIADPRVRYIYKENEERSIARNHGADLARGNYFIFLDSDDQLKDNHLQTIFDYLRTHDFKPRFLFTGYRVFTPEGKVLYQYTKEGRFNPSDLIYGNSLGCSPVVVEKELFLRHRFNTTPDLVVFEDWELWLRIISEEELHCIPTGTVVMVNHQGRSVLNFGAQDLEKKARALIAVGISQNRMLKTDRRAQRRFRMGLFSYVALHVALSKKGRSLSIRYLVKAFMQDPSVLFRRRFLAIIKHLL